MDVSGPRRRLEGVTSHLASRSDSHPERNSEQTAIARTAADAEVKVPTGGVNSRTGVDAKTAGFYKYWLPFQTKWHENDMYDHMNNAVYVTYWDAIINEYLITQCGLRPSSTDAPIALIIATNITYSAALEFPKPVIAGLSVTKLGKSSVTYAVSLFPAKRTHKRADVHANTFETTLELTSTTPAAHGNMTHVFVDPTTRKSVQMPEAIRKGLSALQVQ